jgi:prostamide/prostaglandin F2alpha synthase
VTAPLPNVGDPAPTGVLLDGQGRDVDVARFWADRPAVLVFLRYFGCPFCQAQVVSLREDQERFRQSEGGVVLIGQGDPEQGNEFVASKHLPFPCLIDRERALYGAYGLFPGSPMQVFGPRVALPFLRTGLRGETLQRGLRGGRFMQMPGTFVVDTDGVLRFAHRNRTVADSPGNDHILRVLQGLRGSPAESPSTVRLPIGSWADPDPHLT